MAETAYLKLTLAPSSDWGTKKYGTFITELAGTEQTSSLQKIDAAIQSLNEQMVEIERVLSLI